MLAPDTATAQLFRRRIPPNPQQPRYRVTPEQPAQAGPIRGPLIRGDGRFLERAQNLVRMVTESGTELKPVAVVSLASFEEYKRVVQLVAREIRLDKGTDEEPQLLNRFLNLYETLIARGFDTTQPVGLILQTDGILYYPLVFTPLNVEGEFGRSLLDRYAEQLPDGRLALREDVVNWPLGRLFVKHHQGWLFIASEAQLNALPDDPARLLHGLDRDHLFAARFDLNHIPKLATRAALSLGEMKAVSEVETELDKATVRLWMGHLRSLAEQSDLLEYTISYDEQARDYVLRQHEVVRPNTERARIMQQRREATSPYHAFYHPEGSILAFHFLTYLSQVQREQLEIILDQSIGRYLLTEEERQELKPVKPTPAKRDRSARRIRRQSEQAPATPPATVTNETATVAENDDPRQRLANLLSKVPPEQLEEITDPQQDHYEAQSVPELTLSTFPEGSVDDVKKLEIILRRIGACYYWGLIGAVRSGTFDGALTCSHDHGFLTAFNIVEGDRFLETFDSIFEETEKHYPELYAKCVRKDYGVLQDFRFTSITFRIGDLIEKSGWSQWIPETIAKRETTFLFAVRSDTVCLAIGQGESPEIQLSEAIMRMDQSLPVYDLFFHFSAYELGRAVARSGDPNRAVPLKIVAGNGNPDARAYAVGELTDYSRTITVRISALLTPSLWRTRENLREIRSYR